MNKRDFIKQSFAISIGGLLIPSAFFDGCEKENISEDIKYKGKILIIGAGAAGLYAGYLLKSKGIIIGHKFGDGPSWIMRVIRTAGDLLGFDSDFLLRHSFKRNIYFIPLSKEYRKFYG